MAERVAHVAAERVVAAVADEDPLAVAHVPGLAGEVEVRRRVLEAHGQRLGEPPARVRRPEQQVGRGAARGLPGQPALQHRRGVRLPCRHPHRRAVGQHHDEPRVGGGEPLHQRDLVRRAGRCARGRTPRTRRRRAGRGTRPRRSPAAQARRPPRPAPRRRPWSRRRSRRRRRSSTPVGHGAAQLVERDVDPRRVDLRAAGALEARRAGELADHRDRVARRRLQRQASRRRSSAAPRTPPPPRGRARDARRRRTPAGARRGARARDRPVAAPGRRHGRAARSSSSPARTAATIAASLTPRLGGISRSSPAASAATRSCTAPQSETTRPSKPHSPRSTSVSSHACSDA